MKLGHERRIRLRGLAPGRWSLSASEGVVVEPASVCVPHEGTLAVRWDREP